MRYIQNYRLSPEITKMDRPVAWILLTNFAQFDFIRVNEFTPTFSFKLEDLWRRRDELWELLALENLDANRIDELYDQQKKATLDQQFLADLKRWRLLIANGFALRNQKCPLDDITLASQQAVAAEAGGGDLAAIEAEIQRLDREIDQRVYDLYGLTAEEIKIVESAPAQTPARAERAGK
jgi:hypothetical protein